MAEKPILFNTEMVRAILDGRKTQTRRLVKNIPLQEPYFEDVDGTPYACDGAGEWHPAVDFSPIQKGDVLWVRETWCALPVSPGGHIRIPDWYYYRADPELRPEAWRGKWCPSIHMPKEAARLFLRVTGVRIERLQNITSHDALREGVKDPYDYQPSSWYDRHNGLLNSAEVAAFAGLWDTTVKSSELEKYGWDANPWVWVIEFERCEKP